MTEPIVENDAKTAGTKRCKISLCPDNAKPMAVCGACYGRDLALCFQSDL